MNTKKLLAMAALVLLLTATITAGLVWHLTHYTMVDMKFYPKDARSLDLREKDISISHYDKLRQAFPECEIRWNVPFQGEVYPDDTTELTVTALTDADVAALGYFPELETVHAEGCADYPQLCALAQARPEVEVRYSVTFSDGTVCAADQRELTLQAVAEADVSLINWLPALERVIVAPGGSTEHLEALRGTVHNCGKEFAVLIGGEWIPDTVTQLDAEGITDAELELLQLLQSLDTLRLTNPEADPEAIAALQENNRQWDVTWQIELGGKTFHSTATEVDLSDVEITDLALVEQRMAYLPNAQTLILGLCGVDNPDWGNSRSKLAASAIENEDLAAYRDRVRDQYKVVWTVRLGPSIALRTDADNFMPNHFGVGRLFNDYAYNLRYCEDMVCLDVGHMTLTDISFVEYMPKLKYLILAWTEVQYIEPIRSCKNLIWLELDNSCIRDYSPLVDCTALQDLNIGKTYCDITPILEMTWLKNLYMIFGDRGDAWLATQALPDTRVVASGDATVGGGWRRLPNYYDMRDMLGMYYMN